MRKYLGFALLLALMAALPILADGFGPAQGPAAGGGGGGGVAANQEFDTILLDIANQDVELSRANGGMFKIGGLQTNGRSLFVDVTNNAVAGIIFEQDPGDTGVYRFRDPDITTQWLDVNTGQANGEIRLQASTTDKLSLTSNGGAGPTFTIQASASGGMTTGDNTPIVFGSGGAFTDQAFMQWNTQTGADHVYMSSSSHWVFSASPGGNPQDYTHTNTSPKVFIHSDTAAGTATDQWLGLAHNATDAILDSGAGSINLIPADGLVTVSDDFQAGTADPNINMFYDVSNQRVNVNQELATTTGSAGVGLIVRRLSTGAPANDIAVTALEGIVESGASAQIAPLRIDGVLTDVVANHGAIVLYTTQGGIGDIEVARFRGVDLATELQGPLEVSGTVAQMVSGTGTPEAVVTAPVGSTFTRTDGGAGTTLYVKETGAGNTGWAAVASGGAAETLSATLTAGNATGGTSLLVSSGDSISSPAGVAGPGASYTISAGAGDTSQVGGTITINGGAGNGDDDGNLIIGSATTGEIQLGGAASVRALIGSSGGSFEVLAGSGTGSITIGNALSGILRLGGGSGTFIGGISEAGTGQGDIQAGEGGANASAFKFDASTGEALIRSSTNGDTLKSNQTYAAFNGLAAGGVGLGSRVVYSAEDSVSTLGTVAHVDVSQTVATTAAQEADYTISLAKAGTVTTALTLRGVDGDAEVAGGLSVSGTVAQILSGSGTPEAAVTAPVGSMWLRTDGGTNTTLYIKETGAGNTGWVAK